MLDRDTSKEILRIARKVMDGLEYSKVDSKDLAILLADTKENAAEVKDELSFWEKHITKIEEEMERRKRERI